MRTWIIEHAHGVNEVGGAGIPEASLPEQRAEPSSAAPA